MQVTIFYLITKPSHAYTTTKNQTSAPPIPLSVTIHSSPLTAYFTYLNMTNNIDQVFNTDNPNTIAEIIVNEVNICIETIVYV